jgi:hypothetical protein
MSSSAQIKSTVRNIDVGNRNATNRSGRSSLTNFNRVPQFGGCGSDENAFSPIRSGPAIVLLFWYLGAMYPLILSIFPFCFSFILFASIPELPQLRVRRSNGFMQLLYLFIQIVRLSTDVDRRRGLLRT